MWKLKLPDNKAALDELETALTLKNGKAKFPLSAADKIIVQEIYDNYETLKGVSNNKLLGAGLTIGLAEAIEAGYGEVQLNNRLEDLRNRLLVNAGLCPCCGILPADELDHHLPKSVFKALAVYSSNLVPYCHKCNNKKRAVTGDDPAERFIHFYYDDVPEDVQFFFAVTKITNNALEVNFELRAIPELNAELYGQLSFQTQRVGLNSRLAKTVNDYMSSFAFGLADSFNSGGEVAAQKFLQGNARQLQRQFGINHWRTALLTNLSENRLFYNGGFFVPLALTV
ncbi:hypothetical protein FHW88_003186 [Mucilaginibacter sp. SG538B]|uniref:HNH endonuclease signature motif containing protein n=1 Tax=unclassified Mucilaginibacter TaxID=2617802 RepID=UPI0008711A85|nr:MULTISPECIES: HNH endonuclease signature motif containing protein [unclassified Mucilaginibacter]NVM64897.1 hypothetical protein [Mucilaginibacter sp. SG538B]SCW83281.1 hypothetical protein SAMN03159284_04746 [Mucilaginibacter sp. NFR10]